MCRRILWVEDEEYYMEELIKYLKNEEIEVVIANTNKKWKDEIKKVAGYYDLVILDIKLIKFQEDETESFEQYRRKGEEILKILKTTWSSTPVLIFTAKIGAKDVMMSLGADDYIEKPIPLSQFREVVFKWLNIEKKG